MGVTATGVLHYLPIVVSMLDLTVATDTVSNRSPWSLINFWGFAPALVDVGANSKENKESLASFSQVIKSTDHCVATRNSKHVTLLRIVRIGDIH